MRRRTKLSVLLVGLMAGSGVLVLGLSSAGAHECWDADEFSAPDDDQNGDGKDNKGKGKKSDGGDALPEGYWREGDKVCRDTPVAPNWRDPYVPVFGLEDHEDEEERRQAQRWRDEWGCDTQHCVWVKTNSSIDDGNPNAAHAGTAADHSMFEVAHESEDHGHTEGNHDAHGGAVFVDVCLGSEEGTSYEGQAGSCRGPEDTQVGVVLMDHNPCGLILPYVACTDEYKILRPLDQEYNQRQIERIPDGIQLIADDPPRYLCGHHPSGESCRDDVGQVSGD
jgi:hypothetical protein